MALSSKAGVFTANTSTGNQAVTGVGFQPKAIIFFGGGLTADGNGAGGSQYVSLVTSSSKRECVSIFADDGGAASNTGYSFQQAAIVLLTDGTPTADATADFVSMDADGFTVNWTDAPASAVKVNYIALGGTTITNVDVGTLSSGTGTGSKSKTGVGFQPDVVLFIAKAPSAASQVHGTGTIAALGIGGFTNYGGSIQQGFMNTSVNDGGTTNQARLYERTDQAIATELVGTKRAEGTGVSMDADGFTVNLTTNAHNNQLVPYLAIKGGSWKFGSDSTPTSTGALAKSGIGFAPNVLLAFGHFATASSSVVLGNIANGIGAASSSSAARTTSVGISQGGLVAKQRAQDAKVVSVENPSLVTVFEAAVTSLDSDGWTLNWTTVQGTAREYIWLAGGVPASPPVNSTPPNVGGNKYVGGSVTTDNGTWTNSPSSYTYQWQRDASGDLSFVNISLATSASYTLVGADQDCNIRCVVTATNAGGSTPQNSNTFGTIGPGYTEPAQEADVFICGNATSETFTAGANLPVNSVAPAVTGNKWNGQTLTTTNGTWTFVPSSFTYQWQRADDSGFTTGVTNIGTSITTFVLTSSEIGKYVRCQVTATNADGSSLVPGTSNVTGAIGPSYTEPGQDAAVFLATAHPQESYVDPSAPATGTLNAAIRADDNPVLAPFGI